MRQLSAALIAAVSIVTLTQIAFAADLPRKAPAYAPPPPPAVYNWTGFYAGVNAGGHWAKDDVTTSASVPNFGAAGAAAFDAGAAGANKPSGFIGGLQLGYNWQFSNFVFGLEGDVNGLTGKEGRSVLYAGPFPAAGDTFTASVESNFLATVRGRVGWAFDRALLYATGGLAVGTINITDAATVISGTVLETVSETTTRTGWTVGGGFEYALTPNWTVKVEYLYVDLGSFDTNIPCVAGCVDVGAPDIVVHHKWTDNIGRVGLNYKFF